MGCIYLRHKLRIQPLIRKCIDSSIRVSVKSLPRAPSGPKGRECVPHPPYHKLWSFLLEQSLKIQESRADIGSCALRASNSLPGCLLYFIFVVFLVLNPFRFPPTTKTPRVFSRHGVGGMGEKRIEREATPRTMPWNSCDRWSP